MADESRAVNCDLRDFQYWAERAETSRARADEMLDWEARFLMIGIAEMYDRLAARAFKRAILTPAESVP